MSVRADDQPRTAVDGSMPPPGLIDLAARPSTLTYLKDVWARREFAISVPLAELRAQHLDTVLGNVWHLLNPLLLVGIYFLMFGVILQTDRGIDNFLAFLTIGIFTFRQTQKTVIKAAGAVASNQELIRSIRFPRAILPISAVIGETVAFAAPVSIMLVVALSTGASPGWTWLLLVPLYALQVLFNLGLSFYSARLTDSFRDLQNILPFLFRLMFYMSGVLYAVDRFIDDPLVLRLFVLNPLYAYVKAARDAVLEHTFAVDAWMSAGVWTILLLLTGFVFFRAKEQDYGRA